MKKHIKKVTVSLIAAIVLTMGCATMSMAGTKCLVGSSLHDCVKVAEYTMASGLTANVTCNRCTVTKTVVREVTKCTKCGETFWNDKEIYVHGAH